MLQPKKELTDAEVQKGLKIVIADGLAAEAMTALTGGAFLVSMALLMGANNFQIGLLASLPTFTNIFQLFSIWLVRRFNNRRAIAVICGILARIPLLTIGALPFLFSVSTTVEVLIFFLFFHYFFGSIAGPSWNSWMKDLVPEKSLGAYFSRRSRLTQTLNIILSIVIALFLDYIKQHYPERQLYAYGGMFIAGGVIGILGALILSRAPEPQGIAIRENLIKLIKKPLQNSNFRRLLLFNSLWVFAINIATPFFTVYLLKRLGIGLSYVIILGMVSQVSSILTIRLWGTFADRYSNKTIIAIAAPIYVLCFLGWSFVGIYSTFYMNIALLVVIYVFMGFSTAGINLSLTNIGLKLAPREEAIVYLSARNVVTSAFSSVAPLVGGYLADFFTSRHLYLRLEYGGPTLTKVFRLVELQEWNFLFIITALLALFALQFLVQVKETGEVDKEEVRRILRKSIRGNLKEYFLIGHLISWHEQLWAIIRRRIGGEQHPL